MATQRNQKRKQTKSKKTVSKKPAPKKGTKKGTKKTPLKKAPRRKSKKNRVRGKSQNVATLAFEPKGLRARSGGQSGDLQGLSGMAGADSESVDELLEEGNAFEAEVVKGVEDASDADESEVVAHEVPEDDIPEEYLDKDH
jgi:hypothetical protein